MNNIDALIAQLCPDGVEFRELQEIFEIKNGYTPSKAKTEYWTNGTIPWFRMDDIRQNGRILSDSIQHITPEAVKGSGLFPANSIIVATTATIGEHALIIVDSLANQQFTFLTKRKSFEDKLDMKFFYYHMFIVDEWCKNNTNISGFASVDMGKFKKYEIPIPPLPIQQEIVNILDKFTSLQTELQTELQARRAQYEYYREQLLVVNDQGFLVNGVKVEWKTLGKIAKISNGKDHKLLPDGSIPVYGSGGIMRYANKYIYDQKSVLIPRKGSIGNIFYIDIPFWTVDTIFYTKINCDVVTPKYLYYYLKTQHLEDLNTAGGVPSLTKSVLDKVLIPIPPLAEQNRIVGILDKFDKLVNDISEGLPAEIQARRKQYEYYRGKLLDFKPLTTK